VRYLSFLGIGQNVKQCAFIMHTAQDLFIAHVFNCEPSSGALCKTIEAACKVCDPHPLPAFSLSLSLRAFIPETKLKIQTRNKESGSRREEEPFANGFCYLGGTGILSTFS
jgi:hypothetical protein